MIKQKGIIHIPVLVVLLIIASATAILITQNPNPDTKGVMIAHKEDGDDDRSGSSESKDEEKSEETKVETKTEPQEQKTEVRFGEGEKIKTKIEDGRTRIDVYSGGVKVRYETRDGRVTIKAETEEGQGIPEQELFKIVDRADKSGIKVATAGGELLVSRNNIGATSNFPLRVDLNTNQLIVTTPAGTKVVTILPDQAVQNMLAANVISRLGPSALTQVASVSGVIQLGEQNNIPVYEIPGIKQFNLLGFIPVERPITAVVSAETGELITTQQSLFTRVVDLLSP